jgi:SAM-dependent methyltransferase
VPPAPDYLSLDRRYRDQAAWTRGLRQKVLDEIGVEAGARLLDIGAGTGAVADDVLRSHAGVRVTAVDLDGAALAYARTRTVAAVCVAGDAHALPFRRATFDVSFFHFVLLWLKHPVAALSEAARVTRPHGHVIAFAEPDHRARVDAPAELEDLGRRQTEALANQGADTRFGRKLRAAFAEAGLRSVRAGVLGGEWVSGRGAATDSEWPTLRSDLAGSLDRAELERLESVDRRAWAEGARVLFVPTFYAIGEVP